MNLFIGFILIYLSIIGGAMFISSILNKKIELTIAVNIGIIILALYIFGLLNILLPGVYIIVGLNIILGITAIIIKKKKIMELVCTPGLALFTLLYFVLFFTNYNKALVGYDHFLYRSLNVKMMFNTDSLFQEYERLYQPASTLIEYFFMKLIGEYKQGIEAFAMQLFGLSVLLPMIENVKKSKLAKVIISIVVICLPALFTTQLFYESSYPDATLGLILGYILYIVFFDNSFKFKTLVGLTMSAVIVITKPTGVAIILIGAFMLTLYELLKKQYYKKENIKNIFKNKNLIIILAIILSAVLAFGSWNLAVKIGKENLDTQNVVQAKVTQPTDRASVNSIEHIAKSYMTAIVGNSQESKGAAKSIGQFVHTLYYNVVGFISPVELSFVASSILIIIGYLVYYYKTKDKDFKNITIVMIVGFLLYMLFMQMYFAAGNKGDTLGKDHHLGLDRYSQAILITMVNMLIYIIFRKLNSKEYKSKYYIIVLAMILLFTPLSSINNAFVTSGIYNISTQEYVYPAENKANIINEKIEEKAPIITIAQDGNYHIYNYMLRYYLYPNHKVYVLNTVNEENIVSDLINLKEYKYIYVYSKNDKLEEIFRSIFGNEIILKDMTLYKVTYNENKTLEIIEN